MPLNIHASARIRVKLKDKHNVSLKEVEDCFLNRIGKMLEDTRANNKTHPPTLWFIAVTNHQRTLKIVFVLENDNSITLKTAYEPNTKESAIYKKYA